MLVRGAAKLAAISYSALVAFTISQVAMAADLDVKGAAERYERQRRIADSAKGRMDSALQQLRAAEQRLQSANAAEDRAERELASAQSNLTNIDNTISRLEREIDNLESDIQEGERKLRDLRWQAQRLQSEVDHLRHRRDGIVREIAAVDRDIAALEGKPDSEAELARLRQRRASLVSECDDVDRDIRQAQSKLSSLESDCRRLENDIRSCESDIRSKKSSIADCQRQRQTALQNISDARDDLRRAQDAVSFASRDVQMLRPQYQSAKADYDSEEAEAGRLFAYYQQVKANYEAALSDMYRRTELAAKGDAAKEAGERAPSKGTQDGNQVAQTAGTDKGKADGMAREDAKGYADGRAKAASDMALLTAYGVGTKQGKDAASAKALSENFPLGYNDSLKAHFAGAPTHSATVDISGEISSEAGGSGNLLSLKSKTAVAVAAPSYLFPSEPTYGAPGYSVPGVSVPSVLKTHYSPPCTGLVLQEFEALCRSRYEAVYQSGFETSYQVVYRQNFRAEYESTVGGVYQATLAQHFGASFVAGRTRGATEQGVLDGFAQALAAAQSEQYNLGAAAFAAELKTGAVVISRGATLEETSGDGLVTPGEAVRLSLVLDNYGLEATARARVRVSVVDAAGVGQFAVTVRELPALAANTRTRLTGVLSAPVATEFVGEKLRVKANVEVQVGGAWKVLSSVEPEAETHFPLELSEVNLPTNPKVNQEVTATLKFTNQTKDTFSASKLVFDSKPNFVIVAKPEADVPELAPGATAEVPMVVKPGPWVPLNSYVRFVSQLTLQDGRQLNQSFAKYIQMARNSSIELFDGAGKPIPSSTVVAKAGSLLTLQVRLAYHAKTSLPGPFVIRAARASVPTITTAAGSTTAINYGSMSPSHRPDFMRVFYNIPAALKGKKEWVMFQADEGASTNHVLMVYLDIQ